MQYQEPHDPYVIASRTDASILIWDLITGKQCGEIIKSAKIIQICTLQFQQIKVTLRGNFCNFFSGLAITCGMPGNQQKQKMLWTGREGDGTPHPLFSWGLCPRWRMLCQFL
jgi:hypothetical protein